MYLSFRTNVHLSCFWFFTIILQRGLRWWLSSKVSACSVRVPRDTGSIPRLQRSPEAENGNRFQSFQSSCLENPTDRGAWRALPMGLQRVKYNWGHTHTYCKENLFVCFFFIHGNHFLKINMQGGNYWIKDHEHF